MTTTLPSAGPGLGPARPTLPAAPRDRRRPALAALAILLILAGALGSALVAYRSGDRVDVLVAAREIPVGARITDSDLVVAQVAADGAQSVAAAAKGAFVGTYATTTVPEGTLINRTMFRVGSPTPAGAVVVGVVVSTTQRPAAPLQIGDVVRAYLVPKGSDGGLDNGSPGDVLVRSARVVDVRTGVNADSTAVSLLVSDTVAPDLVAPAAGGQVALTLLPNTVKPTPDVPGAGG